MTVPKTLPAPRRNLKGSGMAGRFDDIVAADIAVAAGDYTGGAAEDLFTLASHGFISGDVVAVLGQTAKGTVTGGAGLRAIVKYLTSSTFQLTSDGTTVIENSSDGTAFLLRANGVPQAVVDAIVARIIVAGNDTTGGTVEDMVSAAGMRDAEDGDTLKLLYKSAAGAAAVAADASVYVKSPVSTISATGATCYFQTAATSGGSVLDTTADGVLLWLLTS